MKTEESTPYKFVANPESVTVFDLYFSAALTGYLARPETSSSTDALVAAKAMALLAIRERNEHLRK